MALTKNKPAQNKQSHAADGKKNPAMAKVKSGTIQLFGGTITHPASSDPILFPLNTSSLDIQVTVDNGTTFVAYQVSSNAARPANMDSTNHLLYHCPVTNADIPPVAGNYTLQVFIWAGSNMTPLNKIIQRA